MTQLSNPEPVQRRSVWLLRIASTLTCIGSAARPIARLWSGPRRVFLFVPPGQRATASERPAPANTADVATESGGKIIFVNRALVGRLTDADMFITLSN